MAKTRKVNGKYNYHGYTCKQLNGTRAQVWHGTACKTAYGLTKKGLHMNKNGRIVSKKKHETAKKEKRLEKHGYFAKKGKFGYVKGPPKKSSKNSSKRSSSRRRRHNK